MAFNLPASRRPRNAMHPGPASRPGGGCMRESTETPHQLVASGPGMVEFREAGAVQEFRTPVKRHAAANRRKGRDRPLPVPGRWGLRGRCRSGLPWGPPTLGAALRLHWQTAGESGSATSRGHSGGQRAALCTDSLSARQADSTRQPPRSKRGPRQRKSLASPACGRITGERPHATPDGLSATSATRQ